LLLLLLLLQVAAAAAVVAIINNNWASRRRPSPSSSEFQIQLQLNFYCRFFFSHNKNYNECNAFAENCLGEQGASPRQVQATKVIAVAKMAVPNGNYAPFAPRR